MANFSLIFRTARNWNRKYETLLMYKHFYCRNMSEVLEKVTELGLINDDQPSLVSTFLVVSFAEAASLQMTVEKTGPSLIKGA